MRDLVNGLPRLLIAGAISSLIGGYFILETFRAGDCDGGCNAAHLLAMIGCLFLAFTLVGCFLMFCRNAPRPLRFIQLVIMASVILLPTGAMFLWKQTYPAQLHTNQDDSFMLIAEHELPDLGIKKGQRCIFSEVHCAPSPPHIRATCGNSDIAIPQTDWSAFKRLPQEDFGIPPSSSIRAFPRSCAKHAPQ
ncbi:MAG: hypothetical protein QE485_18025 [Acidovorax sp.]|uniref:hypothetical protein n=1 Tax=Acidovorax sp. TaxID=1872122 RepID=UPI002630E603|nr:hypothetical protein [Acidovorax sp.]MDH4419112.1 hypothetical protein [Acidovorax sp.]